MSGNGSNNWSVKCVGSGGWGEHKSKAKINHQKIKKLHLQLLRERLNNHRKQNSTEKRYLIPRLPLEFRVEEYSRMDLQLCLLSASIDIFICVCIFALSDTFWY